MELITDVKNEYYGATIAEEFKEISASRLSADYYHMFVFNIL